ncbi:MAG: hypothetical protein GX116_01885 [Fibrobacter sp.]|jgi:preprotein translocase subunit SecG|nr:hypothetical protein [Fibrobacter sp.]
MNFKTLTILSVVMSVALLITVFMQKGSYVSQAKTAYENQTKSAFSNAGYVVGAVNNVIQKNTLLWKIATDASLNAKTSKDFALIEKRSDQAKELMSPEIKTDKETGYLTRKVAVNSDYYIIASFNKKNNQLMGVNVDALLGKIETEDSNGFSEEDFEEN